VAEAVAASNAEIAAILAEDLNAFGDSLADDVIVNSPLGTINHRDDTLAAFRECWKDRASKIHGCLAQRTACLASRTPPSDCHKN
jgi:hypothetical protein